VKVLWLDLKINTDGEDMFNSYSSCSSQNIKINAVTGAILKNHPKSWFERFNLLSDRAKALLHEGGNKAKKEETDFSEYRCHTHYVDNPDKDIIVLQMVICGDMEVIAECVHREDYEQKIETE
jgi:hypothetical protein